MTSICATTITDSIENLIEIGMYLNELNHNSIIGWHIEGPYISKEKKGAHDESLIKQPTIKEIKRVIESYKKIKIFTIAPEIKNIVNIFNKTKDHSTFLSIGHTNANYEEVLYALNNGFNRYTHLYNAMSPFSHRNPGAVNVALGVSDGYTELISDYIHVDKFTIINTFKIIKANRIILVSDSLPVKGLEDKNYNFENFKITKKGDVSYIQGTSTLAGSNASYFELVKKFKLVTNCNLNEIVLVTSLNCARSLKIDYKYGKIKEGYIADFIIISHDFNLISTYKSGIKVF